MLRRRAKMPMADERIEKLSMRHSSSSLKGKVEGARNSPIAVIGCTPNGDNSPIKHELVTFHGKLMGSRNEIDGVVMCERFGDIGTKQEACTPR